MNWIAIIVASHHSVPGCRQSRYAYLLHYPHMYVRRLFLRIFSARVDLTKNPKLHSHFIH
jgi:hypothetical protein